MGEDISVDESDIDLDFTEKDEFFHSVDEYGISEFYGCKKMLYKTVGDSGVKVWDLLLIPGTVFLMFLAYSLPRTRHKLASAPLPLLALYILLVMTPGVSTLRAFITTIHPPSSQLDKLGWSITRSISLLLELTALTSISLPTSSTSKLPRILLGTCLGIASLFLILDVSLELSSPTKEFHVYSSQSNLYGEGGGMFVLLTLAYLSLMLLVQLLRGLGGLL